MALIGRIIVIVFALMLASLAAGMVVAAGLLGPAWHGLTGDPVERGTFWLVAIFASSFTGAIGFLPLLIVICVTEALKIRSLLAYVAGGAVFMVLALYAAGTPGRFEESIDNPPPAISRETEIAAAAGAAFGLVYWLVAGRRAGAWRREKA